MQFSFGDIDSFTAITIHLPARIYFMVIDIMLQKWVKKNFIICDDS